jgi:hypothetical protein
MSARGWEGSPRHVPVAALHLARRLPGRAGRLAGASLAMDRLPPAEDDARGRVPDLPCTSVAELLAAPVR